MDQFFPVEEGEFHYIEVVETEEDENYPTQAHDICLICREEPAKGRRGEAEGREDQRETENEGKRVYEDGFSVLTRRVFLIIIKGYAADKDQVGRNKG